MRGARGQLPREPAGRQQDRVHQIGCLTLLIRQEVRVGVERERHARVPEPLRDNLHVDARLQRQRRGRVPQVVEAQARDSATRRRLIPRLASVLLSRVTPGAALNTPRPVPARPAHGGAWIGNHTSSAGSGCEDRPR